MDGIKLNAFEINSYSIGSTGGIMLNVAKAAQRNGFVVKYACANIRANLCKVDKNTILIGNRISSRIHYMLGNRLGLSGLLSIVSTILFLAKIKKSKPNIIHLHNLHTAYINLPLLFRFIKHDHIPIIWTLHDCWSFTGRCPHFVMAKCDRWKTGCHDCPYPKKGYPQSYIDTTRMMWKLKRRWFTGIENMTIVTPSEWLAGLVRQSFLKDYPIKVINNGIDLTVFKPTESDFRSRHGLVGKKVVLGVAFGWGERKGLDVFIELLKRLPENYRIVLVGTDDLVDVTLPANVISIHRTQNQTELAEIYTAADVFANPTREEVLGLVNVESLACGTPVVTFKTGGSPECIDETCGSVVPCDDIDALEMEIRRICEETPYSKEACIARSKNFDMNARFQEYVDLYKEHAK